MKCAVETCENEARVSTTGRPGKYCSDACKQRGYRNRKEQQRNKRMREQRSRLFICPIDLDTANTFVSLLHRHNKPVPGAKFNLAVVDETGLLRGVAIVGRPVARNLDDGLTLEVNRVCTDGCPNSCSALYGAARKVAFSMGYCRIVTYTLVDESGASMRGAGWRKVAEVKASDNWTKSRPGRSRSTVYQSNKWRWETINPEYTRNKACPRQIVLPDVMTATEENQLSLWMTS